VSDRALTLSAIIVSGGFLLGKILGLVRERFIASAFGTGPEIDAFKATLVFSDLLDSVIAGTTLASVFIPVFSRYLVVDNSARAEGWRFASAVLNAVFLGIVALSGIGMIFAPAIVASPLGLAPGFAPEQRILTANLLRIVLFATIIFGVSGTLTGILHAHNHFVLPSLAPAVHNIGIITGVLVLVPRFGIYGLAYGVLLGSVLHAAIQLPGIISHGGMYFFTLGVHQKSMRDLAALFGPRFATTIVIHLSRYIMTNLASGLGTGSVSALSYATSIWQFPETLIGTAIALAAFPRLASATAAGQRDEVNRIYRLALISIVALAIPAMLIAIFFARPIIAIVYRGGEFGVASTELVATVLQFFALAIVGESVLELTARIFYAHRDSRTPMYVAFVSMAIRVLLMWWGSTLWGAAGLALGYSIGILIEGFTLYILSRRLFVKIPADIVARVEKSG
jgi:putative peptidoglycan lipid II flippase